MFQVKLLLILNTTKNLTTIVTWVIFEAEDGLEYLGYNG